MLTLERARRMGAGFIRQLRVAAAYKDVFAGEAGELVLYDILAKAGVFEIVTVVGAPDASAFRDGRRSLALDILKTLRWDAERLVELADRRDAAAAGLEQAPTEARIN